MHLLVPIIYSFCFSFCGGTNEGQIAPTVGKGNVWKIVRACTSVSSWMTRTHSKICYLQEMVTVSDVWGVAYIAHSATVCMHWMMFYCWCCRDIMTQDSPPDWCLLTHGQIHNDVLTNCATSAYSVPRKASSPQGSIMFQPRLFQTQYPHLPQCFSWFLGLCNLLWLILALWCLFSPHQKLGSFPPILRVMLKKMKN